MFEKPMMADGKDRKGGKKQNVDGSSKEKKSLSPREAQAEEAGHRRKNLAALYHPTIEEIQDGRRRLSGMVEPFEGLDKESPTIEKLTEALDALYDDTHAREKELKQLLIESTAAKISESIRHFFSKDNQKEFQPLLRELEGSFSSFQSLLKKLKEYEDAFNGQGITRSLAAEYFIRELQDYLDQTRPKPVAFMLSELELSDQDLESMTLEELETKVRELNSDLKLLRKEDKGTRRLEPEMTEVFKRLVRYRNQRERMLGAGKKKISKDPKKE